MCRMRIVTCLATLASAFGVSMPTMPTPAAKPSAPAASRADYQRAFDHAVDLCERCLSGDPAVSLETVPDLLVECFEGDYEDSLARCARTNTNVTCLCPKESESGHRLLNGDLIEFQANHVESGRRQCLGGNCGSACSRTMLRDLATTSECQALMQGIDSLTAPAMREAECTLDLSELCATGDVRTTLLFLRLVERLRRRVAHEYGLPLGQLVTQSAFTSRIPAVATQDDYGALHADESSSEHFHYSAVLHLHSSGDGFTGGDFIFSDDPRASDTAADPHGERTLTRVAPLQGRAVMFSSGWENLHFVDRVSSGVRFALPVFFRTQATPADDSADADADSSDAERGRLDHTLDMCRWLSHVWGSPEAFAELQCAVLGPEDGGQ